ncbi:DNA polymerase III, delta subunit [Halothece sp. PCC 7418]|uniref:DNA polymerase III subunit delta n=1 Tax=Halothece sp. (strain PCC 7418) TaxID=65093 RepID=UPI0002A06A53|nr:DNA polymerase III subunit delta [Halothece sp. PCC 7418]AFZ44111.1 DNA polymerase III, delta subunit [Halothece sp. PCC 7418]
MPIYFFWGEDEYRLNQAVTALREKVVDPLWGEFNEDVIAGDKPEAVTEALYQALTPPFGAGSRLVWVMQTTLGQRCSSELLSELERTFPQLPETSHLLLTSDKKPDGRLKSTKLLKQYAVIKEFAVIPPWKTDQLLAQVETVAQEKGVQLTTSAKERLAEAVGNNTRLLSQELEKLSLYAVGKNVALDDSAIAQLVSASTHNSLQLAKAISQGNTNQALQLVTDLLHRNEPALKIVAVLVGQFRTWFWIKLKMEQGERDNQVIAKAAEINNPKRVYFLRQEVQSLSVQQFLRAFPLLCTLETNLKRGHPPEMTLQTHIIQLSQVFQSS